MLADEAIDLNSAERSDLELRVEEARKALNEATEDEIENAASLLKQSEVLLAAFNSMGQA